MFAIAFDLVVADTLAHHPKGVRVQGSLYNTPKEDLSALFRAIESLRALPWFPFSVRDLRAFRVEQWSDFTALVKELREVEPVPLKVRVY
jgi:virulence-associated protein VapD